MSIKKNFEEQLKKSELSENHSSYQQVIDELVEARLDDIKEEVMSRMLAELSSSTNSLTESVKHLNENSESTNKNVIKAIAYLSEKVENLSEQMSVEIPTPVVRVTMPEKKLVREVHRDDRGLITHISERYENDEQDTDIETKNAKKKR